MISKIDIRRTAENLHKSHRLQFPVDINIICEKHNIEMEYMPLEDDVSGMIVMGKGTAVIIINSTHHPNRKRFTGAHELGHFFLHFQDGKEYIDRIRYRKSLSEPPIKPDKEEVEANNFAAELLMPRFDVDRIIQRLGVTNFMDEEVSDIANYFGVSIQAMTIRLSSLGYIPDIAML